MLRLGRWVIELCVQIYLLTNLESKFINALRLVTADFPGVTTTQRGKSIIV
jgi:hypothetical protein